MSRWMLVACGWFGKATVEEAAEDSDSKNSIIR